MKKVLLLLLLPLSGTLAQTVSIIPVNSSWKYRDNGSNQGTAWRSVSFNDATWSTGNAELGYGDGDEATVVSYGSFSFYKHITTYFRKSFAVSNPAAYSSLTLSLKRDDGAVVYLNGTEVARSNMPTGTISYTTRASAAISGTGETTYLTFNPSASLLLAGNNVLAVEIHQYSRSDSDISFNLGLDATQSSSCGTPGSLSATSVTASSATISWGAVSGATAYNMRYRPAGGAAWTTVNTTATSSNISGLTASTQYEYSVQAVCGAASGTFSVNATFTTLAPACGTPGSLTSSSITSTSATLGWSAVTGATGYNIQYRVNGTSTWTTTTSTSASKTLSGLNSGTKYDFGVQAVCGAGSGSWSATASFSTLINGSDTLITSFASWKYLDNGTNQGTAWQAASFNDGTWATGNAELGYGDGDEATVVGFGSNSSNKYITTYFRKSFNVNNPAVYASLSIGVIRDDGIVVYLNGTEVYRSNLPTGSISYTTLASAAIGGTDESTWITASIPQNLLITGTNVIAAEIHQNAVTSSDISFKLRCWGTGVPAATPPVITRGPYLQKVTPNSITVRWRTDIASDSKVQFGTSTAYGSSVSDATPTTEHIVNLTGLSASTRYYYSIGTTSLVLQGDTKNNFYTSTPTGTAAPIRVWVTGDFGNGSTAQTAVRDAFATYNGTNPVNLWIWLGDNAYTLGTDAEYQSNVFSKYPDQFKSIPVYPSPGNHDYAQAGYQSASSLTTNFPYFSMFTIPQAGEAGGVASGTPKYYSYNYGNIHFISLDSYGALNNASSPMYQWLSNDLAANAQRWTVVYFHHPPYTKGTHNSDTDAELINMRTNIIPLLENYHVDLVLCGHSHINERSYLIKGHYGLASTFTSAMKVSTATNTFTKTAPYDGTIYAICGTSGQSPGTTQSGWPMPCMFFNNNTNNCSMVLDVNGDNLTARYLTSGGSIVDQFSITKTGSRQMAPPGREHVTIFHAEADGEVILDLFLEHASRVEVNFVSVNGASVPAAGFESSKSLEPGFHREYLEHSHLAPGIYLVKVLVNGIPHVRKILIH